MICPLTDNDNDVSLASLPVAVSAIGPNAMNGQYGNVVKILNREFAANLEQTEAKLKEKNEIGVCVKQLHSEFSKTKELIEFLELYKILGSSHFTFYNKSISQETNCILEKYLHEGTIEVLPWDSTRVVFKRM